MIGDRERRDDDGRADEHEDRGPLDAMVRLSPPLTVSDPADPIGTCPLPPAWVERYGRIVVVRHTFPDGSEPHTVRCYGSDADALRGLATQVATLLSRGYMIADGDSAPDVV